MRIFCLQSGLFRAWLNTRWSMGFTPSSPSLRTHPKGCHVAGEVGLGAGWQLAGIGTCFSHTSLQHPLSGPQPPRLCGGGTSLGDGLLLCGPWIPSCLLGLPVFGI